MTASIADLQVSSASKQYVRVPVTETSGGDPTTDAVAFAFPSPNQEPVTFYTGSWTTEAGIYYAQCLIGPGTPTILAVAFYDVYVKISDNPETPVLLAGLLEVT
jgi:hypothetical protein